MTAWSNALVAGLLGAGCMQGDAGSSLVGDVRGPDRHPLPGVLVSLDAPAQRGTDRYFRADSAITDSTGCYHLFALHAPGAIRVSYSLDGYRAITLTAPGGNLEGRTVLHPASSQQVSDGVLRPRGANGLPACP